MNESFSLASRGAVVTGAASGIGASIARLYAQAGARLVLADRDNSRLEIQAKACRALGVEVLTIEADVGEETGGSRALNSTF